MHIDFAKSYKHDDTGKKRILFIHIPKTAGTTIRKSFWTIRFETPYKIMYPDKTVATAAGGSDKPDIFHDHVYVEWVIDNIYNGNINEFLKHDPFTIVRNPYSRLVSWFCRMHLSRHNPVKGHEGFSYQGLKDWDKDPKNKEETIERFENWVLKGMKHHYNADWMRRQLRKENAMNSNDPCVWRGLNWLEYKNEVVIPKENIIRFEELEDVIPCLKTSRYRHRRKGFIGQDGEYRTFKEYYTNPKVVDIITEVCKDDLDYFNYSL